MSDLRNVSSNPHIRAKDTTSRIMLTVVIALLLPAFFGIYNFGFRALVLILISIATCVLTEYIYEKLMKKPITIGDFSAVNRIVTGIKPACIRSFLDSGCRRRICNPGGKDAVRWTGTELHEPGAGRQMLSADFLYLPDDEF